MELKPVEFSAVDDGGNGSGNGGTAKPLPPRSGRRARIRTRPLPSDWESHVYQLERDAALDLGFTVGSVKASANTRLLVMDTVRAETIRRGRRTQRWGCGYRLQIEISDITATGRLTLPAIAASVEIGQAEASIMLQVKGYPKDDLWDVIPDPKPLDVESYKNYLEAAARIKHKFMQIGDQAVSTLLATDDPKSDLAVGGISSMELEESSAVVWALRELEDRRNLAEALQRFPAQGDEALAQIVEGVYRNVRGNDRFDSDERVDDAEARTARDRLAIAGLG
jgi:hypothetical protein